MTHELVAEADRLSRELVGYMTLAPVAMEVPLRLHTRETDAGGAPELHPEFLRWIGSVCRCGRKAICAPNCRYDRDQVLGHLSACEPACTEDSRFHRTTHRNHPNRMKRALRQIRRLNPKAYDFVYLIVALHYSFDQAAAKLNADEVNRGREARSLAEYAVLWVSGASMLTAGF